MADRLGAMRAAANAPASVPSACARKGKTKCFGSNRGNEAFSPSTVVMSAPAGGGITLPLISTSPTLTRLPMAKPSTTANTARTVLGMRSLEMRERGAES